MTDYILTFDDGSSACLSHYGVKGMKWGKWNAETRARYQGDPIAAGGGIDENEYTEAMQKIENVSKTSTSISKFFDNLLSGKTAVSTRKDGDVSFLDKRKDVDTEEHIGPITIKTHAYSDTARRKLNDNASELETDYKRKREVTLLGHKIIDDVIDVGHASSTVSVTKLKS